MKITLIRPNMNERRSWDAMEPLAFAILKSLTPDDVELVCFDDRIEKIPLEEPTDLVALTVETFTARRAYQIAAAYRQRGVPVVMGGYHPTLLPEEAEEHADAIVLGDAEGAWENVVEDARNGTFDKRSLKKRYRGNPTAVLDGALPDRSVYQGKRYAPVLLSQYGRGCRFNCDFCSITAFYGKDQRQRPVQRVVEEIARSGRRHVFFVDDNLFVEPEKARELFKALIPLNVRWSCQVSIDILRDPELVDLMARSGCLTALIGFESLDPVNLKQMRKGWNQKFIDYPTAVHRLHEAGIMVYGTFVFGYDNDTVDSFDRAVDFALESHLHLANFNPLTPTPGTPLYDRLHNEGRLLYDRWWLDPRYRYGAATFHPRGMSADELTEGCYRARTAFNTVGSMAKRLFGERCHFRSLRHVGVFLLANAISRHEIHSKQGSPLGATTPGATTEIP